MKSLALFGFSCLTAFSAWSYSIYVNDETGDDGRDGTTPDTAVKTIQKGIDLINKDWHSSREVICATGTYKLDEPIRIYGGTKICSATGNPADVIIDGQGKTRCAWTRKADNTGSDWNGGNGMIGVTVCNGFVGPDDGDYPAGFYVASGIISNCVFRDCVTVRNGKTVRGGAIKTDGNSTYGMKALIYDTLVTGNVISNIQTSGGAASIVGAGIYLGSGGGLVDNCIVSNNMLYCRYPVASSSSLGVDLIRGAGVYIEGEQCKLTHSVICCNLATNDHNKGWAGSGGGVAASSNPEISDCLIYGNMASASGAGIAGWARISRCTIRDNVVNPADSSGFTGGAGVALAGSLEDSIVRGNILNGTANKKYSSGGIWLQSPNVSVRNCLIENNVAPYGGAFSAGEAPTSRASGVVSNCLIRCNVATKEAGVVNMYGPNGVLFTDCAIVTNTSTFASICSGYSAEADLGGFTFRNCYFTGNTNAPGSWVEGMFVPSMPNSRKQPFRLEYCTIVSNLTGWRTVFYQNNNCSNIFVTGCVFFGNRVQSSLSSLASTVGGTAASGQDLISYAALTNMSRSVSDSTGGVPTGEALCNLCGTSVDMKFRSWQSGDYRPQPDSPLVDRGVAEAWMGVGRKNGCHDMGDGTFTVTPNGKYGVTLTRNNSHARLYNGIPDAGCFEWWTPPGMLMLLK